MFYYYGRKKQLAKHYPEPQHDIIVEPFAGAAAYSLHGDRWKKQVKLIEKDQQVVEIWKWLTTTATKQSIMAMPLLTPGEKSSEFLHIIHAASKQAFHYKTIKVTPVLARNWEISRRTFAENIHKIRHWEIIEGDYTTAPDVQATWFIDPPYQGAPGEGYRHSSKHLDYDALAQWTHSRKGQVIACESGEAKYLPFTPLKNHTGVAGRKSIESVYIRNS
jgi:site-specific DNA-adenine methylase